MSTSTFDFSSCFNQAWETYKKNALLLIGATAVSAILISFTIGILAGPLMAGLFILMLKLIDGDSDAKFEDIFGQFDTFKTTFLLCFVWGIAAYLVMVILSTVVPFIGSIASMLVSISVAAFLMFAIILAAQKKLGFSDASKGSLELIKANLWPILGYTAVGSVISSAGVLACIIGVFVTTPFFYLMMACAFKNLTGGSPEEMIDIPMPPPEAPTEEPAEEKFADIDTDEPVEIDESDDTAEKEE